MISHAIALANGAGHYANATAVGALSQWSETLVDLDIVPVLKLLEAPIAAWYKLTSSELLSLVVTLEPRQCTVPDKGLSLDGICLASAQIADARSPALFAHSVNVAKLSASMAKLMGLDPKCIQLLQRAALVHDIGKIGISTSILEKTDCLTLDEWSEIHRHPRYTKEILDRIPGFHEISSVAVAHHERLDGSGYPCGLAASELTLPARILTIADIYDALTSERPYRRSSRHEEALLLMSRESPRALDRACLTALAMVTSCDFL